MDFKERLKQETIELKDKTNKLNDFMRTEKFYQLDRVNKNLLYAQYHYMVYYLETLGKRCEILEIKIY